LPLSIAEILQFNKCLNQLFIFVSLNKLIIGMN